MDYETLRYERDGHVTVLTYDRPGQRNAVNRKMNSELHHAWQRFRDAEDEFVLVIDLTDPVTVGGLVKRTQEAFAEPFVIDGVTLELGLSIGVVVSKPNDRIEHLIHCADEAMYDATTAVAANIGSPAQRRATPYQPTSRSPASCSRMNTSTVP